MNEFPVVIDDENKIKIKPELMIPEKLYPVLHDNSIFLFYKDDNELINCYEITDKIIIERGTKNPDKILEILEEFSE